MPYNTGNPIPSSDAKDLSDNAENLDNSVNTALDTWTDRLGVERRTIQGQLKLLGYTAPDVYAGGLVFTIADNMATIDRNGTIYAPKPSSIPFTTSGTWTADDENKFFVVQGATLDDVVISANTVADMKTKDLQSGQIIRTKVNNTTSNKGGALYLIKTAAEFGGTPDGFGDHTLANGNVAVLQNKSIATSTQYSANSDGVTDSTAAINAAYTALDSLIVDAPHAVADIDIQKPTTFIDVGKFNCSGTFSLNAEVEADNREIFDTTSVTSYAILPEALHKIKSQWFSLTEYGFSQTVYGNRAGAALIGQKAVNGTDYNVFYGYRCGERTNDASQSAFYGTFAGTSCTFAHLSTGLGYGALSGKEDPPDSGNFADTVAASTTAIGQGALQDGTSHTNSTVVGSGAAKQVGVSQGLTVVGANAGRLAGDLSNCVLIGGETGYNLNTGNPASSSQYATMVGDSVGFNISTAYLSTLIGARSGLYSDSCDGNTWVGYITGPDSASYKDVAGSICLGSAARTRANDTITIGNNLTNTLVGKIAIGNSTDQTRCDIAGIYNNTNAAAANMYIGPDGQVYRSTSSLEYKDVIEPMSAEWAYKVLDFEPILYKPKQNAEHEAWTYYGYGAEQVAEIDPRFVQMARKQIGVDEETGEPLLAEKHTPNGVMYDRIVTAQGLIIKDLLARIEKLEGK